ncbi:protein bicaudal C homolog 1-like isoform X2 [Hydra vulgaris]|uniref:Protein bicaudal C homolog 1-like isoform X2 n=1 Tax=Hydra vulgaris TaxID=6087 RepID=A0ABM4BX88_HYDVU
MSIDQGLGIAAADEINFSEELEFNDKNNSVCDIEGLYIAATNQILQSPEKKQECNNNNTVCEVTNGSDSINDIKFDNDTFVKHIKEKQLTTDFLANSKSNELNEERFRVDRKKLESLLQDEKTETFTIDNETGFFSRIEQATNTKITWPTKLKTGTRSKKDPYIKVAGLPEDRLAAKQMVLSIMDTKSTRVALKMDVSFVDHSHIIGKGGSSIKKVMRDTQCHIHFPDSNRTSSEKSNQVSIAGPPFCVESARQQIRELLPIVLKFEIPSSAAVVIPDSSSPAILNIAQSHNVTISFQQQQCSYGYVASVRGLHSDPFSVRDAVLKVLEHLTGMVPITVPVTTQLEVDPKHHMYVIGRNGCNIKKITHSTGASVHFSDPFDPASRKSTVTITGSIEAAVTAKVFLLEYLPLILMFDVRDGEADSRLEEGPLNQMMDSLGVNITIKPKPRQSCKSVIIKGYEKNASSIYRARLHLMGEDPSNMPFLSSSLATLVIPPPMGVPFHLLSNGLASQPLFRPKFLMNKIPSPLTPPIQSSSPLTGQGPVLSPVNVSKSVNNMLESNMQSQRSIGSEIKIKRLSFDGLIAEDESNDIDGLKGNFSGDNLFNSRSSELIMDSLTKNTSNKNNNSEILISSGTWESKTSTTLKPECTNSSGGSIDSGLSHSQEESTETLANQIAMNLKNNQKNISDDYEIRKQRAKSAMQSQVSYAKARTPTDAWSGFGFSNSMPEIIIKDLWNAREKQGSQRLHEIKQSPDGSFSSSCGSSNELTPSVASQGLHSSETCLSNFKSNSHRGVCRPPPGLEDSHPSLENLILFNDSHDYSSMMPSISGKSAFSCLNVKSIGELFSKLGLEQYTEAFQKEEVDLSTFMSLTDDDLKELGVSTFGARKKMSNAMKELNKRSSSIQDHLPTNSSAGGLYRHLDVAAHSLRW